jgi:hypothetical protein
MMIVLLWWSKIPVSTEPEEVPPEQKPSGLPGHGKILYLQPHHETYVFNHRQTDFKLEYSVPQGKKYKG